MRKWVKTICDILRTPEYPQITRSLVRYDFENASDRIIGKCALGEISCRVGLPIKYGEEPTYKDILHKAGVPQYFIRGLNLPFITSDEDGVKFLFNQHDDLDRWIWWLNDHDFSYNEIADFLETTFGGV